MLRLFQAILHCSFIAGLLSLQCPLDIPLRCHGPTLASRTVSHRGAARSSQCFSVCSSCVPRCNKNVCRYRGTHDCGNPVELGMLLAITHDIGHKGYINIGLAVGGWRGHARVRG
jgi:hypothetical protein